MRRQTGGGRRRRKRESEREREGGTQAVPFPCVYLYLSIALELLLAPFICADARSNCDGIMRHRFQQGHIQTGERFTVALANIAKLEAAAVAERDAHVPMASR